MKPETAAASRTADAETGAGTTETETTDAGAGSAAGRTAAADTVLTASGSVRIPPKPTRPPRRRSPKLDELLASAVDEARSALTSETGLTGDGQIGTHVSVVADDDRLVTHRFAATLPGYGGWEWFATLARAPRSKVITVCEVGLLPGRDAILAPDWVPWSERVSQEEKIRLDAIAAGEDPEKALARARDEARQEPDEDSDDGATAAPTDDGDSGKDPVDEDPAGDEPTGADAPADGADENVDVDAVDTGSDAADADAGDETAEDGRTS